MSQHFAFVIPGEPVAKGRPRFGNGRAFTPEKTLNYENLVKTTFLAEHPNYTTIQQGEPIRLNISAFFSLPKSASNAKRERMLSGKSRPTKRPDVDNLVKIVADALNGLAYHDDSQIVECSAQKFWCEEPRVIVWISQVEEGTDEPELFRNLQKTAKS